MELVMSRIIELASSGFDEYLQGQASDPWGSSSALGLRVPTLATPDKDNRYLFLLASFTIGEGASVVIKGYRQYASLGVSPSAGRFIEQEITSPAFRLPDGNISWAIRGLGPPNAGGYPKTDPTPNDLRSFKKFWADGPCLLYQDYTIAAGNRIYPQLTSYTAPNLGRPWGTGLRAGQHGDFTDLRTPWRASRAWNSLDVHVDGPNTVAFFASVKQSTGVYPVAAPSASFSGMNIPEEAFMANFGGSEDVPRPIYWRVGGALIVEVQKGFTGP
jgi:hypothetical protein